MNVRERVDALRAKMKELGVLAYCIPSSDPHQSEYLPESYKTREYISGFTGSAGTALVTMDEAILWTDGRYFLQAEKQLEGSPFVLYRMGEPDVPSLGEYLSEKLKKGDALGFDGKVVSLSMFEDLKDRLADGVRIISNRDLVAEIWEGRSKSKLSKAFVFGEEYAGESVATKIKDLREVLREKKSKLHCYRGTRRCVLSF